MAVGALRLGTYIRFIPYPVTVGFTAGIAVIIFASQFRDAVRPDACRGRARPNSSPSWRRCGRARGTVTPAALAVARRGHRGDRRRQALAAALAGHADRRRAWRGGRRLLGLPVATIGSTFGELPRMLPAPALPELSMEAVRAVLPWAASFTLLGAIESLLSAVVADGMTGRRHRSNCELVAQGVANIGSALFGGFCVTGTIARTATNVRAGSRGPVSGMLHSLFLLVFMLVAAPLGRLHPAGRAGRRAGGRRLEHGREGGILVARPLVEGRCDGGDRDLPAGRVPRPDRGHRRRLRAWADWSSSVACPRRPRFRRISPTKT